MSDEGLFDRGPTDQIQVLDADGRVREGATVPDLADDELVAIYREMKLARHFDERAVSLQRQGRMGTYAPLAGQEAAQVASTHALADDDWLVYQYREHGAVVVRGLAPEYLLYWMGHEVGNAWLAGRNVAPLNISIGSQIPHATGVAWASKLKEEETVVVCHFGDGATSEGDFHEGLNFAGVFDVPAIFFCNNNQWAISVPRERQTAATTLAQKARAYGFEGVQVDGMDPLAVYRVTAAAARKARESGGTPRPTLIEAVQYRFGAHTTADDPDAYRSEEEVERWRRRDPIPRFEAYLRDRGLLDDERVETVEREVRATVDDLVAAAEEYDADPASMFDYTYADSTPRLAAQRDELDRLRRFHGDSALRRED